MTKQLYIMSFLIWLFSTPVVAGEPATEVWSHAVEDNAYSWNVAPAFDISRPESGIDLFAIEQRRALFAAGLERKFNEKFSLGMGVNLSKAAADEVDPINYEDFYLGMNYGRVGGRVWYRDNGNKQEDSSFYYEAGLQGAITSDTRVSFQLGQEFQNGRFTQEVPDLSISAQTNYRGYNFGVRVIDHSGLGINGDQDFSLIGSFQKRFP